MQYLVHYINKYGKPTVWVTEAMSESDAKIKIRIELGSFVRLIKGVEPY